MNLVGKIFIVLILVMSILFMAFSISVYHTHRNWQDLVKTLRTDVSRLGDENSQLEDRIDKTKDQLAHEKAARTKALAGLETSLADERTRRENLAGERDNLQERNDEIYADITARLLELENLQQRVTELRSEVRTAQQSRDESFQQVRQLTDKVHEAKGIRSILEQRLQQLTQDFTKATTVLKAYDLTADSPVHSIPPQVEGEVVKVLGNSIEVSVGEHDGLKEGHTIVVSRRDKYLGRAEITRVGPDRAVGRISYRNAPIQEGDRVQTKVEVR